MNDSGVIFGDVLLVEDEAAHALLIERSLRGFVNSLTRCETVTDARRMLKERVFDLIISDLNLPDMRSEAAVLAVRDVAAKTPLLVLTSSATLSDGISAMRAGADDFLVKNFDANFRDVLQLVLGRLRSAKQAEQERAQATRDRDLLREAIENSDDGLAVVYRDGRVRYSNSAFDRFLTSFGIPSFNVLEIPTNLIVRGDEVMQKVRERLLNLAPGSVWATELVHANDDEGAFDLSLSVSRGESDDQTLVLWVRDIREKKRRERFQREILSTTTHDLKGPLGAIAVSCDVLLDKPTEDTRVQSMLERIATSANSAINLIEEFLSMRRIEEGAFVMHPTPNTLSAILQRVLVSFQVTAKTRGIEFRTEIAKDDIVGCVDALGFERVVTNLVSNAVKFSNKGSHIDVSLQRIGAGVVLTVQDHGAGMEPSDAQRLFQRYSRLAAHAGVSGSGLGLFIVKCIVSAHGGAIDVTSAVGQGTSFEVFFPDAPPCNERGEILCLDFA
jgi:signal transduction histidine kinase